jgi:hypothetical protein
LARNVFDQFAIGLKYRTIRAGKMKAIGMIPQCLSAYPASDRGSVLIPHQEPNAIPFQVFVVKARKHHWAISFDAE